MGWILMFLKLFAFSNFLNDIKTNICPHSNMGWILKILKLLPFKFSDDIRTNICPLSNGLDYKVSKVKFIKLFAFSNFLMISKLISVLAQIWVGF